MSDTTWTPAISIDVIRDKIRDAIFCAAFHSTVHKINRDDIGRVGLEQKACGFAEFGVLAGLITPDEGNDWLDAIWGRKPLAVVADRYSPEKP